LKDLFSKEPIEGKMPEYWKKSYIEPVFKGKGDIHECGN